MSSNISETFEEQTAPSMVQLAADEVEQTTKNVQTKNGIETVEEKFTKCHIDQSTEKNIENKIVLEASNTSDALALNESFDETLNKNTNVESVINAVSSEIQDKCPKSQSPQNAEKQKTVINNEFQENADSSTDSSSDSDNSSSSESEESSRSESDESSNAKLPSATKVSPINRSTQQSKTEVVNKNCQSLKNLLVYANSDDDSDCENDGQLRTSNKIQSSSEDSESDSSSELLSDDESDDEKDSSVQNTNASNNQNTGTTKKAAKKDTTNIFDEEYMPTLPDISKLNIAIEKEEFLHIGAVSSIIEKIVTVETVPGTPAFDLDTILYIESTTTKRVLGPIYDVIGPVTEPIYCIKFMSETEIEELCIKKGSKVFAAPKNEYTKYVFLKELLRIRGTDASWRGDQELPPEFIESSDEDDAQSLQEIDCSLPGARKRKYDSLERHQRYEQTMNRCNTLNTMLVDCFDPQQPSPRFNRRPYEHRPRTNMFRAPYNRADVVQNSAFRPPNNSAAVQNNALRAPTNSTLVQNNGIVVPPPFNPAVPPPSFYVPGGTVSTPYQSGVLLPQNIGYGSGQDIGFVSAPMYGGYQVNVAPNLQAQRFPGTYNNDGRYRGPGPSWQGYN